MSEDLPVDNFTSACRATCQMLAALILPLAQHKGSALRPFHRLAAVEDPTELGARLRNQAPPAGRPV